MPPPTSNDYAARAEAIAGHLRRWLDGAPTLPGLLDERTAAFCWRKLQAMTEPGLLTRKLQGELGERDWRPLGRVLLVVSEDDLIGAIAGFLAIQMTGNRVRLKARRTQAMLAGLKALLHNSFTGGELGMKDLWRSIGPTSINGRWVGQLYTLGIAPLTPRVFFVGGRGCGVWRSRDGAATWAPITDGLQRYSVASLALDPTTPSQVYLCTETGSGQFEPDASPAFFTSIDGGDTWSPPAPLTLNTGGTVPPGTLLAAANPSGASVLYLSSDNVYRSDDSGTTWRRVKQGPISNLAIDPSTPTVLYAAVAGVGVFKTTTGGSAGESDWSLLGTDPRGPLPTARIGQIRVAIAASSPSMLYALIGASVYQVYRSTDGGATWTPGWSFGMGEYVGGAFAVDASDASILYAGGVGFYRSTDGGATFPGITGPHGDYHVIANDPFVAGTIYVECDGGIFSSTDRGDAWAPIGVGIRNLEFFHMAVAFDRALVLGGLQDNGNNVYDGSSLDWRQVVGGDGFTVDIDRHDSRRMAVMGQFASSIAESSDGGASFPPPIAGTASGLPACAPIEHCMKFPYFRLDPNFAGRLLLCATPDPLQSLRIGVSNPTPDPTLYAFDPTSSKWSAAFSPASLGDVGEVVRVAVDPINGTYFVGTNTGVLYEGPDLSSLAASFRHPAYPNGPEILAIEIDPVDPSNIYVAFNSTGADRLHWLTPGDGMRNDQPLATDIPPGQLVQCLAADARHELAVFAGTPSSVFRVRSLDGGATWATDSYNNGLPKVDVRDLKVDNLGVLRGATFGRGVWEVDTDTVIGTLGATTGHLLFLRVQDPGTGYGPPGDTLDADVIFGIDAVPGQSFGLTLRPDASEADHRGMLDLLRDGFVDNRSIVVSYTATGLRNNLVVRIWDG